MAMIEEYAINSDQKVHAKPHAWDSSGRFLLMVIRLFHFSQIAFLTPLLNHLPSVSRITSLCGVNSEFLEALYVTVVVVVL